MKVINFGFRHNRNYGISLCNSWIKSIIPDLSQNNVLLQKLYKNNGFSSDVKQSVILVRKRHFADGLQPIVTSSCVSGLH